MTAGGVLGAIDRDVWDVLAIGIADDGQWTLASDDPSAWAIRDGELPRVIGGGDTVVLPARAGDRMWRVERGNGRVEDLHVVDVVFPLLHGPYGEDGTIQGALELVDVPYVGSGVLASAMGMDKEFMKIAFAAAGLPVARGVVLRRDERASSRLADIRALGLPVFVKPARAGSSMGVSKVATWGALDAAIADAIKHDPKVLIEEAVVGREVECAVLGTPSGVRVSQPGEIITGGDHAFYDFEAKYLDEANVTLVCPVALPGDIAATVQDYARRAFVALDAEGIARVDTFVREDGSVVINEVNTMPGFTPFSMYPRMWAVEGIAYPELVETLLRTALDRPVGLR